ncbi:MAG TPA: transcriptional regulator NrdR [Acidimicrobiales bacterium]|nr:transcriptional regulator NrdR [Acidimicrobiales bacterium]
MRCPSCAHFEDRVVDSREVEEGLAVRRRRECLACGYRYTTFERSSGPVILVEKRSGEREPFRREKLVAGVRSACKNRPVDESDIEQLANVVEATLATIGPSVPSRRIGVAVLDRLRDLDEVAYLRFASVYKDFVDAKDFAREADLLQKETEPKQHRQSRTKSGSD